MVHSMRRTDIPENGMITLERAGQHYVIADIDGEVVAFRISGPAARRLDRAVIADGRLCCPLHGWPIDAAIGRCGGGESCRFERLPVDADGPNLRVTLRGV